MEKIARDETEREEQEPYDFLDAGECFPFPAMSFARNPCAQIEYYPRAGVAVLPRVFR
jgi:hypothetical protein